MCEDLENTEGLHHLYEIFKNIFLLVTHPYSFYQKGYSLKVKQNVTLSEQKCVVRAHVC